MLLYSILHLTGYGISMEDLQNFRQLGSPTAGHPEYEAEGAPGIEVTTGPLGQGVGNAVGFALAERLLAARFNRDGHEVIDHHTYAIACDGDMQEGVASEASSLAGHLSLGKLTMFYDNNQIQLAGPTSMGFSEKVGDRYEAYNWHVQDLGEDLSTRALAEAIEAAHADDRPSLIIVQSHIGFGSPNKQDSQKAHGSPLGEDEVKLTKEAYGWDPDKSFYVPDEAKEAYAEVPERGKQLQSEWDERMSAFRDAHGDLAAELDQFISGDLPGGWDADLPRFSPDDDPIATRKASEQVIQWAAAALPTLVSGSADLEPSTNTEIEDGGSVTRDDFSGRNVHYGVREHGMGAIVNGLNLHGVRAFGSTFFNFLDYMKGSRAAGRADGAGRDPRVHARLDRPGRGRPDPPAGRAPGAPARHAERELRAARGRQRDGAGVEVRAGVQRRPDRAGAVAAGHPDPGPRRHPGRRGGEGRLRPARWRRRDPDRHRGGGAGGPGRRRRAVRQGRAERARGEHALLGPLRRGRPVLPRPGAAARDPRARVDRGRRHAGLGEVGRRRRRVAGHDRFRRLGARPRSSSRTSA